MSIIYYYKAKIIGLEDGYIKDIGTKVNLYFKLHYNKINKNTFFEIT